MIEVHSHLLPNIDDGVKSLEEAINTIKKLELLGYSDVIVTPHYIKGTKYNVNNIEKYKLFLELEKKILEENINIKLYLGNEIFVDENILENLKNGNCCPLNNSRYVLIEIPLNDNIINLNEIIFKLKSRGLVPIIAHPERYLIVKKDYNILDEWINRGALLQVNFESITGKYGNESKKVVKHILKNNLATLIGGDIHHEDSMFFKNFLKNKKKIIKLIGNEKFEELTVLNPAKIINNKDI